jgi:hypothetical protein
METFIKLKQFVFHKLTTARKHKYVQESKVRNLVDVSYDKNVCVVVVQVRTDTHQDIN